MRVEDPSKVSKAEAKKFVEEIKLERDNCHNMRDSLCGGISNLGADLYSSQVFFLCSILFCIYEYFITGTLFERNIAKH